MTVGELIAKLSTFEENLVVLVPTPEEPSHACGVAITHVIKLRSGKIKLSCFMDIDRERDHDPRWG